MPAPAAARPKLYSYWRSSASWRVRIALHVKAIDFEYVPVHLVKDGGEQHAAAYRAVNPARLLPTLEVGGRHISQSPAIIEYLEETHPHPALLPSDAYLRAKTRQICEEVNASIQPLQNLRTMQQLGAEFGADKAAQLAWSRQWIERGFVALERLLSETSGRYSVGDDVTMADCFVVPQVYNARRFSVDMAAYPIIERIDAACADLEAFAKAEPSAQPDAQ